MSACADGALKFWLTGTAKQWPFESAGAKKARNANYLSPEQAGRFSAGPVNGAASGGGESGDERRPGSANRRAAPAVAHRAANCSSCGYQPSTSARICRAAGLSRLKQLDAPLPAVRYQRDRPGELIHIDVKRLGRFDRVGHRITRSRSYGSRKQGFEFLHVATYDALRVCYAEIFPDECTESAIQFFVNAIDC